MIMNVFWKRKVKHDDHATAAGAVKESDDKHQPTAGTDQYIYVNAVTFNNEKTVSVAQNDIIVFVGPNNVGKSQSLYDIQQLAREREYSGLVVKAITLHKGDKELVANHIAANSLYKQTVRGMCYCGARYEIDKYNLDGAFEWTHIGEVADYFFDFISTRARLKECDPKDSANYAEGEDEPIHAVLRNGDIQTELSKRFKCAFGLYLIPDGAYDKSVKLRCVKDPPLLDRELPPAIAIQKYVKELAEHPAIHLQGDGMKSFAGILLRLLYGKFSTYFIDEPESFLHPPQAKAIRRAIGEILTLTQQAFISTHSEAVLQGLLEVCPSRIKVIRITRRDDTNEIAVLDNSAFSSIWRDSLLYHSNILEGLFHNLVVVCESDTDCRFYSMIDAHLKKAAGRYPETLFVHCGGKQRLKVAVKALQSLNVPVKVVADMDMINDMQPYLKELAEIVGVEFDNAFNVAYNKLKATFNQETGVRKSEVEALLSEIVKNTKGDRLTAKAVDKIRSLTEKKGRIGRIKTEGKSAIRPGDATRGFEYIDKCLRSKGVFLVPVGELEGFVRQVGGHGSAWLGNLMQEYPDLSNSVYNEAKAFVKELQI